MLIILLASGAEQVSFGEFSSRNWALATIGRYYFRVCTGGVAARGHDPDALLRGAGIDSEALDLPGWRGDVRAMARLVRAIVATLNDEFMGFTVAPMRPGAFAFAMGLAREGENVRNGLERAIRFYNLAGQGIETRLSHERGEVHVTARFTVPECDPDHYFLEFWLMIWHRLACWLAGEAVPLVHAAFAYPRPAHFEEFRHLFPCPLHFGGEASTIAMDARALARPVARNPTELETMLAVAPLDFMTIPARDDSLASRVRALLVDEPAADWPRIAAALGIHPERLRRDLRQQGASLSAIREAVRRDMATRALLRGNRTIEEVSAALGYAESRSFTRAFRAWTGMSPSAYRRNGA
jgi:AraC-like DNA-binding protein